MHSRQTRLQSHRRNSECSTGSNGTDNVQSSLQKRLSIQADLIQNMGNEPDRARSLASYASLASQYDGTVHRISQLRQETIDSLDLRPGEHVLDVACGTGDTLIELARQVSPDGRVVGVEQSKEMAAVASAKIQQSEFSGVIDIHVCPIEDLSGEQLFDAVLMSFTHDVLQNPHAAHRLSELARPGARIAIAGIRFLPWWWAAPINLFTAFRARKYLTTYRGLRKPWSALLPFAPELQMQQTYLVGTCYRGFGKFSELE